MDFITSILSMIFILSIPVFLHELGHYLACSFSWNQSRKILCRNEFFGLGIKKLLMKQNMVLDFSH